MFLYVVVSSVYIINHSLHGKLNVRRLGIVTSQQPLVIQVKVIFAVMKQLKQLQKNSLKGPLVSTSSFIYFPSNFVLFRSCAMIPRQFTDGHV